MNNILQSVPDDSTDGSLPAVSIVNPNVGLIAAESVSSSPQRVSVSPQPQAVVQTSPNAAVCVLCSHKLTYVKI